MKLLFFDTETTGVPKNYNAPISDTNNYPRLVQLAYIITDDKGNVLATKDFIIKPNGFIIPETAAKIHGITTEIADEKGNDLAIVLNEFLVDINSVDILVAHNYNFDSKIVGCEFYRNGLEMPNKDNICTMLATTDLLKLPNKNGYASFKWTTLQEVYNFCFGKSFEKAHNALADITATKECFFELQAKHSLFKI